MKMISNKTNDVTYFAITKGSGFSNVDSVSAFDHALINAGIGNCNLVPVSSIIPSGAFRLNHVPCFAPGTIIHCVLARLLLKSNEAGAVCLGYSLSSEYGIVAETKDADSVTAIERCSQMLKEMANNRIGRFSEPVIESQDVICGPKKHGCGIVVLLLVNNSSRSTLV